MELGTVRRVDATLVGGDVTVAAHPSASRIEAEVLHGPPLSVRVTDGTVRIRHRRRWPFPLPTRTARASVVVFVPPDTTTRVRSVSAEVLVSGTHGAVEVRSVAGSLTLTAVSGTVVARNVSGDVDAEDVTGRLSIRSVSGDVTASGALDTVDARSVSGTVTLDLAAAGVVKVRSVSGDVSVRLPEPAALAVRARTASGRFDSAFRLDGGDARDQRLSGRITNPTGRGKGAITVKTVSGDVALLRREERPEPPEAEAV